MIIDAKVDYKKWKLNLIYDDGKVEELECVKPYFYVIIPDTFNDLFIKLAKSSNMNVEQVNKYPIIWNGSKYIVSFNHSVFKVICESPTQVPKLANQVLQFNRKFDTRISAHNVRYVVRNTFDKDVRFFNAIPLYYGFDSTIIENISKVKALIIDVEVINGEPRLCSCYVYRPFTEVKKDDVISLELPNQLDELAYLIRRHSLLAGHNLIGFDIPIIRKLGIMFDDVKKSIFDIVYTLNTFSQSFQIGSARSLLDLAIVLKEKAGITDEEIEIKRKSRKILKSENWDEIVKYNINDIVLTAKIMDMIFPFIATLSAYTQIPLTECMSLPAGMIAEYFLLHYCEIQGFIPEYTRVSVTLSGERVWLELEGKEYRNVLQADIKMMYPSFVYHNYIDPTLIVDKDTFDRRAGIGLLFSAVRRLYIFREYTKKLKKQDKKFEAMDLGVKAIINALAYGVQGKQSGYSILGNPVTPAKIYYGTRDIQFKLIDYAREKGYHPVYSDTDSIFIQLRDNYTSEDIKKIINDLNQFLSKYGLELDVEDVWDKFYVYAKKNYILKKGDKVIVKGSALINLKKFYLPECISLHELLKYESREDREKYIQEVIHSCEIHELFIRASQQVWRLVGKDYQSLKRMRDKMKEYMRVLTVWNEKPVIYLKKIRNYMISMPHTAPIIKMFLDKGSEIDLHDYTAHDIIEIYMHKLPALKIKNLVGDVLVWDEDLYVVSIDKLWYVLRCGGKEYTILSDYVNKPTVGMIVTLTKLKLDFDVKKVQISEDVLRKCVLDYTKTILRKYGLL